MLNGVLSLGDIRDVEKLCDRIVAQTFGTRIASLSTDTLSAATGIRRNGISETERQDLLAFLIAETWLLWTRYDSADDGRGLKTFSGYAVPQLRLRVVDWWRVKLGRQRPGRATKDNPGEWGVLSTGDLDDPELERALASGRRDDPADRYADLDGLLAAGGKQARGLVDA